MPHCLSISLNHHIICSREAASELRNSYILYFITIATNILNIYAPSIIITIEGDLNISDFTPVKRIKVINLIHYNSYNGKLIFLK